jgi:hypothetical protein
MLAHGFVLIGRFCCTSTTHWVLATCSNASNTTSDDEHPEHAGIGFTVRSC